MVSYGGGANSTALLIGLHQHRIPVDLILFADTGAEHPHTYAYLDVMDDWLKDHGMPPITRVYKTRPRRTTFPPSWRSSRRLWATRHIWMWTRR